MTEENKKPVFLTAEWRKLVMANYAIDPGLLQPLVPRHTELDYFEGKCYVSLVAFMFLNTKLKGIPIPFHQHFEEVNLRFYVRFKDGNSWKRGAVFIKEIVPKFMIAKVANWVYGEPYQSLPMDHRWDLSEKEHILEYRWKTKNWNRIQVITEPKATAVLRGSLDEFITEHYWGYTGRRGKTSEFAVEHPKWEVYPVTSFQVEVNFTDNYGPDFAPLGLKKPDSVFVAEGSEILVRDGRIVRGDF